MANINIPYGLHINVQIPDERLAGVLESSAHRYKPSGGAWAAMDTIMNTDRVSTIPDQWATQSWRA